MLRTKAPAPATCHQRTLNASKHMVIFLTTHTSSSAANPTNHERTKLSPREADLLYTMPLTNGPTGLANQGDEHAILTTLSPAGVSSNAFTCPSEVYLVGEQALVAATLFLLVVNAFHAALFRRRRLLGFLVEVRGTPALPFEFKTEVCVARVLREAPVVADLHDGRQCISSAETTRRNGKGQSLQDNKRGRTLSIRGQHYIGAFPV